MPHNKIEDGMGFSGLVPSKDEQRESSRRRLIRDDSMRLTEDWLSSVMEADKTELDVPYWTPGRGVTIELDGAVHIGSEPFRSAHTRGEVRRLCSVLGFSLDEQRPGGE